MRWPLNRTSPIGIAVDGRWICAVQMARSGSQSTINAATSIRRTQAVPHIDLAEAGRLREVLDRQGFSGNEIVTAVPSSSLITGIFELPPKSSGIALGELADRELTAAHKYDDGTVTSAHWELPKPQRATKGTCVMTAGCVNEDAETILDSFEGAGFRVRGIDTEGWAIVRALGGLLDDPSQMVAILGLGWDGVRVIVAHGPVIVYERALGGCAFRQVHDAVRAGLDDDEEAADYLLFEVGMNEEEEGPSKRLLNLVQNAIRDNATGVARELEASLAYAAQEYGTTVDRLLLVGEGATIPGIADVLHAETQLPTMPIAPDRVGRAAATAALAASSPLLMTACGLAAYPGDLLR